MLIIAFGDIHMERKRAKRIPEIEKADCVVLNGDLTVVGGREEAGSVLKSVSDLNPNVYAHIGNMDLAEVDDMFTEMEINLNGRGIVVGNMGMFGLGGSNTTPFGTPSEFSEEELEERLWKGWEEVRKARFKILFSHPPPADTRLDIVRSGMHVGSRAVREFLERTECQVCICGHIHEAAGTDRLGETVLINPGMLAEGGYARIECSGDGITATLEQC
jgi:Icc-related predicted phosphoesterase